MNETQSGWRNVTLGQIVTPQKDREIPTKATRLPYIGMEHVQAQSGTIIGKGRGADITSLSPRVRAGDVLYGRLRPYLNKVAISPQEAFVSGEFIVFRGNEHVDARWLKWRLSAQDFVDFAVALNTGDRPRVKWPQISGFKLSLPTLDEQRKVVDTLELHLSRIEAGRRGLDNACLRSEKFRTALHRSVFSRYVGAERSLAEAASIENGQTPKGLINALTNKPSPDSVPFYKVGDMNGGDGRQMSAPRFFIDRTAASKLKLHLRAPGIVLIPKRGGAIATDKKRILEGEAAFDLNIMGLRPRLGLSVEYLWRFLQGVDLGRVADGTAVPQINAKQIQGIQIPIVDASEQGRILAQLDQAVEASDALDNEVLRATERARVLRRELLAAAFCGKLNGRPTDVARAGDMAGV